VFVQEVQAHGTLPNGALPTSLAGSSPTILSLIAANELFEVAFFSALIHNITHNMPGFEVGTAAERETALTALNAVVAQEELHAIGANAILANAGKTPIQPCRYVFPSTTYDEAIRFASTLTDLVLGTLQDAAAGFVANGDDALIPLLSSITAQEGEQVRSIWSLVILISFTDTLPGRLVSRDPGPHPFSAPLPYPLQGRLRVVRPQPTRRRPRLLPQRRSHPHPCPWCTERQPCCANAERSEPYIYLQGEQHRC